MRFLPKTAGWIRWMPYPLGAWTNSRYFPPVAAQPLRIRVPDLTKANAQDGLGVQRPIPAQAASTPVLEPYQRFQEVLGELSGRVVVCNREEVPTRVDALVREKGIQSLLSWEPQDDVLEGCLNTLEKSGIRIEHPNLDGGNRSAHSRSYDSAQAGLTGSAAGIAETGTLVVPSGPGQAQLASLLPPIHIALLSSKDIFPDFLAWLEDGTAQKRIARCSYVLVSGPSRTADIEMALTVGVHGPREVIVICYEP